MSVTVASRPSRMMPTRSQTRSTSGMTWELRRIAAPRVSLFRDHLVEGLLHQGIETLGGFVQDQEVGIVHERLDQADLLLVAV